MRPHVDRCYAYIAAALGQDYWLVPQVSAFYFFNSKMSQEKADLVVRLIKHIISKRGYDLLRGSRSYANDQVAWNFTLKSRMSGVNLLTI